MWKKTDSDSFIDTGSDFQEPAAGAQSPSWGEAAPAVKKKPGTNGSTAKVGTTAAIGASITIKGDLTGEEDLVIQGKVEGTIHLNQYNVTVGKNGRIKADVHAKGIKIEGEVEGNLFADDYVRIHKEGHVKGDIMSPNVGLEEGCRFKGSIEMESVPAKKVTQSKPAAGRVAPSNENYSNDVITE